MLLCLLTVQNVEAQRTTDDKKAAAARKETGIAITGHVRSAGGEGSAVSYAVVSITNVGATVTGNDGAFEFRNLAPGEYEVEISSLGYEPLKTTFNVVAARKVYDFELKPANFYVDDVVVTARPSSVGAATASTISRTAIDHLQANSLAEILSLIPGADINSDVFKPDMKNIKAPTIRGGQAMGTAIVMDGAPLSNGANMQYLSGATGGESTGTRAISPTSGIDMRTITTDNIESIEVIRGVASAEYGDAASGAVIINTKAGREPFTVRFNTNPNVYSAAVSHGAALGKKHGFLNYGADYAYSIFNPREAYDTYQRATGRAAYSNTFFGGKLSSNTSLTFLWTRDKGEPNPDDEYDHNTSNQRDLGLRFSTNGTWNANKGWFKSLKYNVSFNYTNRRSDYEDLASNAGAVFTNSKVDGSVLSSMTGKHFYDKEGNEITRFDESLAAERAWYTPETYTYQYNIYGKELNTYAKLSAKFAGDLGITHHRIVVGAEFRNDGNLGRGTVYDLDTPPVRNTSWDYSSRRERAFRDIPFMNQLSLFAEETFRMKIAGRELEIVPGVRYDHVFGFKGAVSPRVNASFEVMPDRVRVRGAYGTTHKMPSLAFLYPDKAYFDFTNFNNVNESRASEAQKFQIITTHAYDIVNPDLEMARTTKAEVGIDFTYRKMRFSITAYKDECHNGYAYGTNPENLQWVDYTQYKADGSWSTAYNKDGVTLPDLVVDASKSKKIFLSYTTPENTSAYERRGIEFDLDFGRIDAIRTAFVVNGEFYDHKNWSNGYMTYTNSRDLSTDRGIYSSRISGGIRRSQNLITNFIVTHNIPKIGFVISMTANVNWREKQWVTYGEEVGIPEKYISIADGKIYDFDPSWADKSSERYNEFRNILYNEDNGAFDPINRFVEPAYKPVLSINVNVTKQFRNFDVSFFAHNLFRSTPMQALEKYPGKYVRRNADVFYFGLQLTAKIR